MSSQVNFKSGIYSADKFKTGSVAGSLAHDKGTIYVAAVNTGLKDKAFIFYDDGTEFLNIVPRMLDQEHGGTNADLSDVAANSVIIQGSSGQFSAVEPGIGALHITSSNGTPAFGILPVSCGGTGAATLTAKGLLIGNGTSAISSIGKGSNKQIVGSNGTTPGWYTPSLSISTTATASTLKLKLVAEMTANLPIASESSAGLVTAGTSTQMFGGPKEFKGNVTFDGTVYTTTGKDAYYNSSSDHQEGDMQIAGGITLGTNLRVDGTQIQLNRKGKIEYDTDKSCFNFIFM